MKEDNASKSGGAADEFGTFRSIFWPIHNYELKKFLPMVVMMFCFLFNYTIMRDTKDTLVVTAAGAEVIPFLKFWGTMPMSIVFVIAYAKLSNALKTEALFYAVITPFLVFFASFGLVIYPNMDLFSPTDLVARIHAMAGDKEVIHQLATIVEKWPYVVFYILSELWGSMGISLLFWQFANQITRTQEAKRFYGGFAQLGNLALILSGMTIIYFSDIRASVPEGVDAWGVTLRGLMSAVTVGCLIIMYTYYWMNRNVLTDPVLYEGAVKSNKPKKEKLKMGILESMKVLANSRYLMYITLLVIGYGMSINMIEVVWKKQLGSLYPNENDYSTFMGAFSMFTGITTLILVTAGSNVIRRFGWFVAAMTAPVMILVTGAIFFGFIVYGKELAVIIPYSPLMIAVIAGAAQNILSKATKYSLFDPTKEMAYIPLDAEAKVKGKAAIDVIGSRLGKSGGGVVLQLLIGTFGSIMNCMGLILGVVALVVVGWLWAVVGLDKLYHAALDEKDKEADKKRKLEPSTSAA